MLAGAVATTAAPDVAQALSSLTIAESPTEMKDVAMKDGKIDLGAMLGNLGGDDGDSPFKNMKPAPGLPAPAPKPAKKAAPKAATLPSDDEAPSAPKFEAPKFDFKMPAMPDIKVPDMPAAPAAPSAPMAPKAFNFNVEPESRQTEPPPPAPRPTFPSMAKKEEEAPPAPKVEMPKIEAPKVGRRTSEER